MSISSVQMKHVKVADGGRQWHAKYFLLLPSVHLTSSEINPSSSPLILASSSNPLCPHSRPHSLASMRDHQPGRPSLPADGLPGRVLMWTAWRDGTAPLERWPLVEEDGFGLSGIASRCAVSRGMELANGAMVISGGSRTNKMLLVSSASIVNSTILKQ